MEEPILSICFVTYNHEKYVAKALDSILSQKTKYKYEINVLEDCSTDGTQEILKKYKELHPDKINLYFQSTNTKAQHFYEGFKCCTAKYVCTLEGDDYWCDDSKIEKQIDFLEANPDFIGCSHNTKIIYESGDKPSELVNNDKKFDIYSIDELTKGAIYCHTSSYIYKNIFNGCLPDSHTKNEECGDWFMSMLYAEYGPIKYMEEVMSVYRVNSFGIWSSLNKYERIIKNIKGIIVYNKLLNYKYEKNFLVLANNMLSGLCESLGHNSNAKPKNVFYKIVREIKRPFLKISVYIKNNFVGGKNANIREWKLVEKKLNRAILVAEKVKNKELQKTR